MTNKKNFYITTPLYYPSANLHIGHAYTTILADIFARYKRENNYNVFFLVGSDEHGQKIESKAKEANKKPIDFVNYIVNNFKKLWKKLNISYDVFERTTNIKHEILCKNIFSILLKKELIYKSDYSGKYCTSCEEFLTPTQLTNENQCITCKNKITSFKEETYFLKISKFKEFLLKLFDTDFLYPDERKNEMVNNFIKPGLFDLSVTRVSFDWGIKINENPKHVLYVWLDALLGYLSGIQFQENNNFFNKYWGKDTEIIQFIGKEITRFHSIYWPIILNCLNLRMPNKLISHGWIVMNDEKMSKSLGNIVDPFNLIKEFGADVVRYFLGTNFKITIDNNYNRDIFISYYNNNLVNNYGNLVSRVSKMILKYFNGEIDNISFSNWKNDKFINLIFETINICKLNFDSYNLFDANKSIMNLFSFANKYIEDKKPWTLYKNDNKKLKEILTKLSLAIIVGTFLLKPILVTKTKEVFELFDIKSSEINYDKIFHFKFLNKIKITKNIILFKRK